MPIGRILLGSVLSAFILAPLASVGARAQAGYTPPHSSVKIGRKLCFTDHYHSGSGPGANKGKAKLAAIRSWADFVDFEYGPAWARWSISVSKKVRYTKEVTGWSATVESRPCKYLGRRKRR